MVQHGGVEVADVVGKPEPVLGILSESQNFKLANEVAERLAGPGDVAVDLSRHEGLGQGSVGEAELVRLSSAHRECWLWRSRSQSAGGDPRRDPRPSIVCSVRAGRRSRNSTVVQRWPVCRMEPFRVGQAGRTRLMAPPRFGSGPAVGHRPVRGAG